jgi:site-specific DNA recombinase
MSSKGNGAILYVRVSTAEQAEGPQNLENQENRCRKFCEQRNLEVQHVFTDAGESARSADRPEFKRMLDYCRAHKKTVRFVVVQDLSRFARNHEDQTRAISELRAQNISLLSCYESNIDDSAAGKLAANVYGAFNQHFSDALSEKMTDRTRAAVEAGRFPWPAPIGYLNVEDAPDGSPNIVPDPQRAPHIRHAFELVATGRYKTIDVLKIVTEEGLRTPRTNNQVSTQTFHMMLRKPVYKGWTYSPKQNLLAKGLYEPIVSESLFEQVQDILSGRKPKAAPKRKCNPGFPLKGFVRCSECLRPLTGGLARGRYGYYWCYQCHAVSIPRAQLENQFLQMLRQLQPDSNTISSLPKLAAAVWNRHQIDSQKQAKRLHARRDALQKDKSNLMRAMSAERDPSFVEGLREEYRKVIAEMGEIDQQLGAITLSSSELNSFVRFVELSLVDIADAWLKADIEDRVRVQNLLFADQLHYDPETGSLNTSMPTLFNVLAGIATEKINLASPTGFEPVLTP